MRAKKIRDNPIFAIAADDYKNQILGMRKMSTYKKRGGLLKELVEEFGHLKILSINRMMLQNFITRISYNLSPNVVRSYVSVFKCVMENADEEWVMPRVTLPKNKRSRQTFYTLEEMQKLIRTARGPERTLIMLLSETGMRIGEALALYPSDIENGKISVSKNMYDGVEQSTPKTDSSNRIVCISKTLEEELLKLSKKGYIFKSPTGRAMWPETFSYRLKEICRKAGVDFKPAHSFRRGNITVLILTLKIPENIVGMRAGHLSGGSMTLGVYVQPQFEQDREYIEKIEELFYGSA